MRLTCALRRSSAPWVAGLALMFALAAALTWSAITPPPAQGQTQPQVLPDAGLQRIEMIQQLKLANQKLDVMIGLLKEIRDAKVAGPAPARARPE